MAELTTVDDAPGVASLRSLGTGVQQAAQGSALAAETAARLAADAALDAAIAEVSGDFSADVRAALAGTTGAPSDTNRYVTDADPRIGAGVGAPNAANNGKWLRTVAGAYVWATPDVSDVTGLQAALDGEAASRAAGDALALAKAANLADLASAAAARTNLGLGTAAVKDTGTGAAQVVLGNDARLGDARTPLAHSHVEADVTGLVADLAAKLATAANLSDLANAATARGNLGLGSAATHAHGDYATAVHTHAESDVTGLVADLAAKAPLVSPALTGNPTAPTPTGGDSDTSIATTAFVQGEIAGKAPLASPALTGNPTVPTQAPGDNSTKAASTAFVADAAATIDTAATTRVRWMRRKSGVYYTLEGAAIGTLVMSNQRAYVFPMDFDVATTLVRIGLNVTVAGAGTGGAGTVVIRLGIWNDDGTNYPGTVLLDAGTIDATSATYQEKTINQVVGPGRVWIGAAAQGNNTTGATTRSSASGQRGVGTTDPTTDGNSLLIGYFDTAQGGAFTTFSSTVKPITANCPRVFVRP